MTPAKLIKIGAALYGERWKQNLARDLGVNLRTIQRWEGGQNDIPAGVSDELRTLISARIETLSELLD